MLLRQMKYLVSVVDCGSFTEAAEQNYISQSAMSQQIQALEKELGVELIQRKNRRFMVTGAGEYFYTQSKAILAQVESMCQETKRLGADNRALLRIGYPRVYSGIELQQAMAAFSKTYPEITIQIINGTHEELYALLRTGSVDLVLNDQRRAFSEDYCNFELMAGGCFAEFSVQHPFSQKDYVELEELKQFPCILITTESQQRAEQAYYQFTLGMGSAYLYADNLAEGRLMVASNQGFLPIESMGTLPPEEASIRRLPIYKNGKQMQRNYCIFWRKDCGNRAIETFAETLKALIVQENKEAI